MFISRKKIAELTAKLADADRKLEVSENNYKSLWEDYIRLKRDLEVAKSTVYAPVVGITETELANYKAALKEALEAAHKRQKSANAKPSEYMKGLELAIRTLDDYPVHELV